MIHSPIFEEFNLNKLSNLFDLTKTKHYLIERKCKLDDDPLFSTEESIKIKQFLKKNLNLNSPDKQGTLMNQSDNNLSDETKPIKSNENANFYNSNLLHSDEEFIKKIIDIKEKNYKKKMHRKIKIWCEINENDINMIYLSVKNIFNKNKVLIPVSDKILYPLFVQYLYFINHNLM